MGHCGHPFCLHVDVPTARTPSNPGEERRAVMAATISRDALKGKIDRGENFHLVEALSEADFEKAHLPGAVNLPADRVRELAPRVLPDKGAEIIVYCGSST